MHNFLSTTELNEPRPLAPAPQVRPKQGLTLRLIIGTVSGGGGGARTLFKIHHTPIGRARVKINQDIIKRLIWRVYR